MEQKLSPEREKNLTAKYIALFPDKKLRQRIAEMPSNQRRALLRDKLISEAAKQGISEAKLVSSNKKFFTINVNGNDISISQSDKLGRAVDLLDKAALKEKRPENQKSKVKSAQTKPKDEKNGVRKNFSLYFTFDPKVHPMMRDPNISFQAKMAYLRQHITNQLLAQGVTPEEMMTLPNRINIIGSSTSAILGNMKGRNMVECLALFYHSYYSTLKTQKEKELINYAQKKVLLNVFDDPIQFIDDIRESLGMDRVYNKKDNKLFKNFDPNAKDIDFKKIEEAQKLDVEQASEYATKTVSEPEKKPYRTIKAYAKPSTIAKVFKRPAYARKKSKMDEFYRSHEIKKLSSTADGPVVTFSLKTKPLSTENLMGSLGGEFKDAVDAVLTDMEKHKDEIATKTLSAGEYDFGDSNKEILNALADNKTQITPVAEAKVSMDLDTMTTHATDFLMPDIELPNGSVSSATSSEVSVSYLTYATGSIFAEEEPTKRPRFKLMDPKKFRSMLEGEKKSAQIGQQPSSETAASESPTTQTTVSDMPYSSSPIGAEYISSSISESVSSFSETQFVTTDSKIERFKDIDAVKTLIQEGVPPAEAKNMAGKKPKIPVKKIAIPNKDPRKYKPTESEKEQENASTLSKFD